MLLKLPLRLKTRQGLPRKLHAYVYGFKARPVNKVHQNQKKGPQQNHQQSYSKDQQKCYRCGKVHKASDCPYKEAKCHFCDKKGHLKAVCQKKQRQEQGRSSHNPVKRITKAELVKAILGEVSQDTPSLGWTCPSQSRTVSSPWNWTLPLREILCLCRSGNN